MIIGSCTSNVDDFRCLKWPEVFWSVPNVGDLIKSVSNSSIIGKVSYITHCAKVLDNGVQKPYIEIYLTKSFGR